MVHPYPHSMTLLKALTEDQPPLAPEPALKSAREAYDHFLRSPPAYANEIEDAIIAYGRILWPYRKAFHALVQQELGTHEDEHFTAHLPSKFRARYEEFQRSGGSIADLYDASRTAARLTATELGDCCRALMDARGRAEAHVREMIARDDAEYRKCIREFQAIQHEIEQHIASLRRLAERTADHPEVFAEIIETVRTFERGLAHLAQEPSAQEVCTSIEGYRARHEYLRERHASEARPRIFR